jgi:hypothetical protein
MAEKKPVDRSNPTWVYHPTEPAKVVPEETARKLYSEGWFDSPAKAKAPAKAPAKAKAQAVEWPDGKA